MSGIGVAMRIVSHFFIPILAIAVPSLVSLYTSSLSSTLFYKINFDDYLSSPTQKEISCAFGALMRGDNFSSFKKLETQLKQKFPIIRSISCCSTAPRATTITITAHMPIMRNDQIVITGNGALVNKDVYAQKFLQQLPCIQRSSDNPWIIGGFLEKNDLHALCKVAEIIKSAQQLRTSLNNFDVTWCNPDEIILQDRLYRNRTITTTLAKLMCNDLIDDCETLIKNHNKLHGDIRFEKQIIVF